MSHVVTRRTALLGAFCALVLQGTALNAQEDVDLPSWRTLKAFYDYDANLPLEVETKDLSTSNEYKQHIVLRAKGREPITALFVRPSEAKTYPCVLLLHGYTSKKEDMVKQFGNDLLGAGFAILALDAPQHGERKPKEEVKPQNAILHIATLSRQGIVDYRVALDYLKTRRDVRLKDTSLVGYSMGGMMGTILTAVDNRIKASVLCVTGDIAILMLKTSPKSVQNDLFPICNSLYAGKITPRPLLFLNGKRDNIVPNIATMKTYDAAGESKEIIWYDSGHGLPAEVNEKAAVWLKDKVIRKR